uniref:WD_REPEATS_REGION domain-containing protein n=1 Tax=Ascaris lumbricoides TaxID=6252 RepID=A0A0M3HTB9_ASCLU
MRTTSCDDPEFSLWELAPGHHQVKITNKKISAILTVCIACYRQTTFMPDATYVGPYESSPDGSTGSSEVLKHNNTSILPNPVPDLLQAT